MDIWIFGYLDIWMDENDGRIFLGGRAAALPPTREFMRGSAPQTPHRFHGHTPPHPTPPQYFLAISRYFHAISRYFPAISWTHPTISSLFPYYFRYLPTISCSLDYLKLP